MRLTKEQEVAVENGHPVHLRENGLECVVIRADLYDRVATLFEGHSPLTQADSPVPDVAGAASRQPKRPAEKASEAWTEEKNDRRCQLIDMDIEGSLSESEKLELERLQECFHDYLDAMAPPPMEGARRLHQQLLAKKRQRVRRD